MRTESLEKIRKRFSKLFWSDLTMKLLKICWKKI